MLAKWGYKLNFILWGYIQYYPGWLLVMELFWSLLELDEIVFLGFPSGDLVVYSGFCFTLSPCLGTTDWCYVVCWVLFPNPWKRRENWSLQWSFLQRLQHKTQWDGDNSSNCLTELLGRISEIVSMKGSTWCLVLNNFSVNISHYYFHCA